MQEKLKKENTNVKLHNQLFCIHIIIELCNQEIHEEMHEEVNLNKCANKESSM